MITMAEKIHIMDRKMKTLEDMKEFAMFDKSLPKRFHKLNKEIEDHMMKCRRCRFLPVFPHKEIAKKADECERIIKKKMVKHE
jgi:hypothetical protein